MYLTSLKWDCQLELCTLPRTIGEQRNPSLVENGCRLHIPQG